MLQLYYRFTGAQTDRLMTLYREGNRENAAYYYPDLSAEQGLLRAREDFCRYLREDFFRVPGGVYCIWEEDGAWVSGLRLEPWEDGLLLEALETDPDFRRQGYGRRLLRAVQDQWAHERIYSHVNKKNRPSLAVHAQCGFKLWKDTARLLDGTVSAGCCTLLWQGQDRGKETQ